MTKQFRNITTLILVFVVPNVVYSKSWYGPPEEVVFGILIAIIVFGTGLSFLISRLMKFIFEKHRGEKRKHTWFQFTLGFLFATIFMIAQANWDWLRIHLVSICNDEYMPNPFIQICFSLLSIILGSIIGYFITPIEKSNLDSTEL